MEKVDNRDYNYTVAPLVPPRAEKILEYVLTAGAPSGITNTKDIFEFLSAPPVRYCTDRRG